MLIIYYANFRLTIFVSHQTKDQQGAGFYLLKKRD